MEILLVGAIDPYTDRPGGTKTYILNLISRLRKIGIDVTLIGISYGDRPQEIGQNFVPVCYGEKISSFKFFLKLFIKVYFLPLKNISIVHVQRAEDILPFVLFYHKVPKIVTVHGSLSKNENIARHGLIFGSLIEKIADLGLQYADRIIAVNDEVKKIYFEKYPHLRKKIVVIPTSVDTTLFKPIEQKELRKKYNFEKEEKIVLYVGRFDKEKGLDFLIEVFKKLNLQLPNSKLILVGAGSEEEHLKYIAKNNMNIIFINKITHSKVPEIMNCANVFALCSYREGMPTVVLEAMACGLPVVSTDVGDLRKIVYDGITGYLVRERDEMKFCNKLFHVIQNSDKFAGNCIKAAQEYSIEKVVERIRSVYDEIQSKD